MDLDTAADELYGLVPEEFTAARTAKEKQAKADGDRSLAAQIHALSRPNQVAWLANQLARHHAGDLVPLLELGAELRGAADPWGAEQLRAFSVHQRQLVRELLAQAGQLAAASGRRVSAETAQGLQDTLHAAMADPDAGERLLAGRLSQGMQHVGFGPGGGGSDNGPGPTYQKPHKLAVVGRAPGKPAEAAGGAGGQAADRPDQALARAERELERARALAADASDLRDEARAELEKADSDRRELEAKVARLSEKLDAAVAKQAQVVRDQRRLRATLDRAERVARDTGRRLDAAQAARQRVADKG